MNSLRNWLRKKLLTPQERELLAIVARPERWQPDMKITPEEAVQWGGLLKQPLMIKIDVAMINLAQQEAQRAIGPATPTSDVIRQTGYALGFRRGWDIAKALSVMLATNDEHAEKSAATGAGVLDQHNP